MSAPSTWGGSQASTQVTNCGWAPTLRHPSLSYNGPIVDVLSVLAASGVARVVFGRVSELGFMATGSAQHRSATMMVSLLCFTMCLIWTSAKFGLYRPVEGRSGLREAALTVAATVSSGLCLSGGLYAMDNALLSPGLVSTSIFSVTLTLWFRRALGRRVAQLRSERGAEASNILIVGTGSVGQSLRNHLESKPQTGFRFLGFVSCPLECDDTASPGAIGTVQDCLPLARSLFVDEIVVSVALTEDMLEPLVQGAKELRINVSIIPELYDGATSGISIERIGGFPVLSFHRRELPIGRLMVKRAIDLSLSLIALVLLLPAAIVIASAIAIETGGPAIYRARRIGRKGREFDCYKFRSMVTNAHALQAELAHRNEREGVLFKITEDPRVTRVGRILRKYSLDEIPQFYNVLRGDMSLVGPRPPTASEVAQYEAAHLRRLDVLPGMTGLWQIRARQDPSFESYILLDTTYVDNWSIWLDLKILIKTIGVVLGGTGS